MSATTWRAVAAGVLLVSITSAGHGQRPAAAPETKAAPRLEAVAETRLLMEGLAHANFRGLERILAQKPADTQGWTFARGQALLLAETANLLMLRPPKRQGQAAWFECAASLRRDAAQLAMTLAQRDYPGSRTSLLQVATTCNRCHQTFRIDAKITAFVEPRPRKSD